MKKLVDFVSTHRERFATEHNNVFAFSFSKITRHWEFLEIIYQRYVEVSEAFVANSELHMAAMKTMGPGPVAMTEEQVARMKEGGALATRVHLEIESFYLFSKILLDEIAHAIEYYFGPARGLSLDSHDDLTKNLERYATEKGVTVPAAFAVAAVDMRKRISDFRDSQIAHEKSPRTMRATSWGPDRHVKMVSTRLYPKEGDRQADTESLDDLRTALQHYTEEVVSFVESNAKKTRLQLAES
jgi:hypothetical protein